ncbi:LysR family transcriptional regulator [uncultured Mailhella sp.]|uniref:LysR family transcriptional regulator n=1 Tax=uncultured Mailhella sp. TaxID=1981031 RepID=UPI0025F04F89|nr:LysR family transcriptional regulator [uncultured Mailhella sp.]
MNIKQLEYFIGAAKSASLNEAAARVFITQPALSASLATLESEMGVTLFSKQKKGIELTPEGVEFFFYAHDMLEQYQRMSALAERNLRNVAGNVSIFAIPSLCRSILVDVSRYVFKNYPSTRLKIVESTNTFRNAESDEGLYLLCRPHDRLEEVKARAGEQGFLYEELMDDQSRVYINAGNVLAKKKALSLADLGTLSLAQIEDADKLSEYPYAGIQAYFRPGVYSFSSNESMLEVIKENVDMAGVYSSLLMLNSHYDQRVKAMPVADFTMPVRFVMCSPSGGGQSAQECVRNTVRYFFLRYRNQLFPGI